MTDYIKLAHRAVNCRKWRWVDGMIAVEGFVTLDKRLPDLTHPATLGCLLALVREQYPDATTRKDYYRWRIEGLALGSEPSEAEALVAALEAAP